MWIFLSLVTHEKFILTIGRQTTRFCWKNVMLPNKTLSFAYFQSKYLADTQFVRKQSIGSQVRSRSFLSSRWNTFTIRASVSWNASISYNAIGHKFQPFCFCFEFHMYSSIEIEFSVPFQQISFQLSLRLCSDSAPVFAPNWLGSQWHGFGGWKLQENQFIRCE